MTQLGQSGCGAAHPLRSASCTIIPRDPTPSRADIEMTKRIIEIAHGIGIKVHDHIIVGRDGHSDLRGLKLI